MPKNIVQYDLLVSCPGDIENEIRIIEDAVSQFNTQFSDALGISVRTKHWHKNSYAQSGGKPQALLNEQFVKDCDAAVAILWTRFGTPTDEYGSGTEEEVEIIMTCDAQKMRAMLIENQKYTLDEIWDAIITYSTEPEAKEEHYFEVEMFDINKENTDLLGTSENFV